MTQLAGDQVARLADQVGIPRSQLVTCVAIAWAESGLRTDATGYNYDNVTHLISSKDRGLWQINDYWHPDVSDACAYDASCNAQAMARISSHGANWNPWSTFGNGAYRNHLKEAQLAVSFYLTGSGGVGGPIGPGPGKPPVETPGNHALSLIDNGSGPMHATAWLIQFIMDQAMDHKYGPGHRTGPVFGGIIQ